MNEQKSSVEPVLLQRRDLNLTIFHHHYPPTPPSHSKKAQSASYSSKRERGGKEGGGVARGKTYKPHPRSYLTTPFQCSQPPQPVQWCSCTYPHAQFDSKSVPFNEGRRVRIRGGGIYPHTHPTTARCRLGTNQALAEYNPPAVGKALFPHQRQANQEEEEIQQREKPPQRHRQSSVPPQTASQESKSQRGEGRKREGGMEEEKKRTKSTLKGSGRCSCSVPPLKPNTKPH